MKKKNYTLVLCIISLFFLPTIQAQDVAICGFDASGGTSTAGDEFSFVLLRSPEAPELLLKYLLVLQCQSKSFFRLKSLLYHSLMLITKSIFVTFNVGDNMWYWDVGVPGVYLSQSVFPIMQRFYILLIPRCVEDTWVVFPALPPRQNIESLCYNTLLLSQGIRSKSIWRWISERYQM